MHDFTLVEIEGHLPLLRPVNHSVKVVLDDSAIGRRARGPPLTFTALLNFDKEDFNLISKSLMHMIENMSPRRRRMKRRRRTREDKLEALVKESMI